MTVRPAPAARDAARVGLAARVASLVLLAGSVVMLAVLVYVGRWLTFWSDEWDWLFRRADPSLQSLLGGSDVHLHLFPVLIYQALFRIVGLSNYYPYLAVAWALHLSCAWLLFAFTGRLAGWGFGLVAGLSLLFLGSGFEVLLQPGQMGYALSEAMGLLALVLLLGRSDSEHARLRAIVAAVALCVGIASSGVGMFFVGLIVVWTGLRRDWSGLASALPAFLAFAIWFPIWSARTTVRLPLTVTSLLQIPAYVLYGLGATVTAVIGLPPYRFALAGIVIAVIGVAIVWWLGARGDALALGALGALVAEFTLVAGFRPEFGIGWVARSGYLHPAAAFLWLIAAAVWVDPRCRLRSWLRPWMVAVVLVLAIAANMVQFSGAARGMRVLRATEIAYLRLLEALRDSPDLDPDARGLFKITARRYLPAIDRFGAPALASREPTLAEPGVADRADLDRMLVALVGASIRPVADGKIAGDRPRVSVTGGVEEPAGSSCVRIAAGRGHATGTWVPATGAFSLASETPGAVRAVRVGAFSRPAQVIEAIESVPRDTGGVVRLPRLPADLRWAVQVDVAAGETVTVCSATAA